MKGDIVYQRRRLTSRTDEPCVNLHSESPSQITMKGDIVYKRRRFGSRTDNPRVNLHSQSQSQITMKGDIVYKRRQLTSITDKPLVKLHLQSPSQIQEPTSSTKMTNESRVNDRLHITDSAKSEKMREHDEVSSEMPNYDTGKTQSLASPDLSAHLDTGMDKPLGCGSDEHNHTRTSNVLMTVDIEKSLKAPAYSSSMGTSSNACLQLSTDNRESMPMQANKQQTVANLHFSRPHGLYLHPEQTINSHATCWSDEELDSLCIGVRRHGKGNWDAILRDPISRSLAWRTPRDLALKWEEEQLRLLPSRTVSHTPLPWMTLPNPNEGSFMWLLRQVEMEAMKARDIANSPSLTDSE